MCHDSSCTGQVVKVTPLRSQHALRGQLHLLRRAARGALAQRELRRLELRAAGRPNSCRWRRSRAPADRCSRCGPRLCTEPVAAGRPASRWRGCSRSPWRTSTLPLSVALPLPATSRHRRGHIDVVSEPGLTHAAAVAGRRAAATAACAAAREPPVGGICDGQGGASAQAAGDDAAEQQRWRSRNGLERSMKGGIIMARRSNAGRKTRPTPHA